jgi:hypothetical protein
MNTHLLISHNQKPQGFRFSPILLLLCYILVTLFSFRKLKLAEMQETSIPHEDSYDFEQPLIFGDFRVFAKITGPDALSYEFAAFSGSGQNLKDYLGERFGIDCPEAGDNLRGQFEVCVRRHIALFYGDYLVHGGKNSRPFPISTCRSIGLDYASGEKVKGGDVSGAQGSVFVREIQYSGHACQFLVKLFNEREPRKPVRERKELQRLVFISEDPKNARRNDKGPFYRELDAYNRLPPSPYFIAPVCYFEEEKAIMFPYYGAGDLVPLNEDGDIFDQIDPIVFKKKFKELVRKLIKAVHEMHQLGGLTHMDIKPENLLIAGKDRQSRLSFFLDPSSTVNVILIDFGLAIRNADFKGLGCIKSGTKSTMSPEQIMCHRPFSPACDWFGLGSTIYWLLVMWSPELEDDAKKALLEAKDEHWQHSIITNVEEFGREFNELLDLMLQLYPEHRQFDNDMSKLYSTKYLSE